MSTTKLTFLLSEKRFNERFPRIAHAISECFGFEPVFIQSVEHETTVHPHQTVVAFYTTNKHNNLKLCNLTSLIKIESL